MLCVLSSFSHVQLFATLWTVAHQALLFHGILQAKNTVVDCHAFLQGIFLTRGLNSCLLRLLHWQVGSLPLVPPGKHLHQGTWSLIITSSPAVHRPLSQTPHPPTHLSLQVALRASVEKGGPSQVECPAQDHREKQGRLDRALGLEPESDGLSGREAGRWGPAGSL